MQSPIINTPEIFFLGINAGDGAYNVKNKGNSNTNLTPLRMLGEDEMCFNELNWFESGNARGYSERKKWTSYEWYQRNKKINNSFPQRMIDLLYEIGKLKYPEEYSKKGYDNNSIPFWYERLGKKIMYTNLYPISTTNYKDLKQIHQELAKLPEFSQMWKKEGSPNEWHVRLFFIRIIDEIIKLIKPKLIVCIGKTAFNDFTYKRTSGKICFDTKNDIPVIGFSREGNWSGLIPQLATAIVEKIK